jgi:hypothetical protein
MRKRAGDKAVGGERIVRYDIMSEDDMSTLPDEQVVEIAKSVATANNVSFANVLIEPVPDDWKASFAGVSQSTNHVGNRLRRRLAHD